MTSIVQMSKLAALSDTELREELIKRAAARPPRLKLLTPSAIADHMSPVLMMAAEHEEMHVVYFNASNEVLGIRRVCVGSIDQCHVDPRLVFAPAMTLEATGRKSTWSWWCATRCLPTRLTTQEGNMSGCICIKAGSDVYARKLYVEATPENIESAARSFADSLGLDGGETFKVGLCARGDAGAARLMDGVSYADGGIEWLYELTHKDEGTYRITRRHRDDPDLNYTVKTGLTLEEAQRHCRDPETSSSTCTSKESVRYSKRVCQPWFDSYEKEK